MSVAISWANKMQLAKCDIMISFPISGHIYDYQFLQYKFFKIAFELYIIVKTDAEH